MCTALVGLVLVGVCLFAPLCCGGANWPSRSPPSPLCGLLSIVPLRGCLAPVCSRVVVLPVYHTCMIYVWCVRVCAGLARPIVMHVHCSPYLKLLLLVKTFPRHKGCLAPSGTWELGGAGMPGAAAAAPGRAQFRELARPSSALHVHLAWGEVGVAQMSLGHVQHCGVNLCRQVAWPHPHATISASCPWLRLWAVAAKGCSITL